MFKTESESPVLTKEMFSKINATKSEFKKNMMNALGLTYTDAPLFVESRTGFNDELNYVEQAVTFTTSTDQKCQVVQSLAKWKRFFLSRVDFPGVLVNLHAIRKDEFPETVESSRMHSFYVDQWDWEMKMTKENRTVEYLKTVVMKIYDQVLLTQKHLAEKFGESVNKLPNKVFFIDSQELEDLYPNKTPKEREYAISKEKGAVFIIGIGHNLKSGKPHDSRAPDYDDWKLNGDLIFYNKVIDNAFEISSMGIRVDKESLVEQITKLDKKEKLKCLFHRTLLEDKLPLTIGGGIGQSRVVMFLLDKKHIGEVQFSVWPTKTVEKFTGLL
ncbi:ASNA [Enterospora canceri]|uniref:ASNA n=1 Tax=Enterospora canceri TaxID=1081671 RepID=A0A1Y1S6X0_9MICR|nr:ASNA [Enterospora canceri]